MKISITCRDKYEAQKLASLVYIPKDNEALITEILNIVENELVVSLKDHSAHSIILKDNQNVEAFADFLQSVFEKKHRIVNAICLQEEVQIIKE